MLFTSTVFILVFLPLLCACYYIIPQKYIFLRNLVLIGFSVVFYVWGGLGYFWLLMTSVAVNYLGGLFVGIAKQKRYKRLFMILATVINLGLLGVYKYAGFATETLNAIGIPVPVLEIVLPIGISFFTFQGLSYVLDVYMERAQVQKNPLNVGLYVILFPQLVAGPIVRYTDVEREIIKREHSFELFSDGLTRFMIGFSKKMLMANPMGKIADDVFSITNTAVQSTPVAWIGAIAYTFQIYFDFSAYSDMAIGLGKMFGFRFNENFNYPYISTSVTEFWRRWHISLSSWFRDYVYIPLGGNRCSIGRHIFNLAVVWMLTGLWHGAAWNFVLWGVYYGLLLILEKYVFSKFIKKIPRPVGWLLTMLIVIIGWVLFRANSLSGVISYIGAMFGGGGWNMDNTVFYLRQYYPELIICAIGVFPLKNIFNKIFNKPESKYLPVIGLVLKSAYAFIVFGLSYIALVAGGFNPFIYFQF